MAAENLPSRPFYAAAVDGTVLYERDGAVATLTLSRPERFNAIVPALIDDLEAARSTAAAPSSGGSPRSPRPRVAG